MFHLQEQLVQIGLERFMVVKDYLDRKLLNVGDCTKPSRSISNLSGQPQRPRRQGLEPLLVQRRPEAGLLRRGRILVRVGRANRSGFTRTAKLKSTTLQ